MYTTNLSIITAIADTGAQSCLWSMSGFVAAGFSVDDLLSVSVNLRAANKTRIEITGAVILGPRESSSANDRRSCTTMVYVSQAAHGFYLSYEVMVDIGIVPVDFPSISPLPHIAASVRSTDGPPGPGNQKDYGLVASNADCVLMSSTHCSPQSSNGASLRLHGSKQRKNEGNIIPGICVVNIKHMPSPLPALHGRAPVKIHLKDGATPKAVHTPALIPVHWQERVYHDIIRDELLGVIERVPHGEAVTWCHRMVVTRKQNGSPRRTVDLSPLNKHCARETFSSESPFHLARRMPGESWKTVRMLGTAIILLPSEILTGT